MNCLQRLLCWVICCKVYYEPDPRHAKAREDYIKELRELKTGIKNVVEL